MKIDMDCSSTVHAPGISNTFCFHVNYCFFIAHNSIIWSHQLQCKYSSVYLSLLSAVTVKVRVAKYIHDDRF